MTTRAGEDIRLFPGLLDTRTQLGDRQRWPLQAVGVSLRR